MDIVKKALVALLALEARLVLRKYKPKIIAVTGNVGKTSTKDVLYAVLSASTHVRKSEKSFNTEIGIPLTILGCPNAWNNPFLWLKNILEGVLLLVLKNHYPKLLVLEVGADHPGDIKKITSWLTPDVVVLTRLPEVPVHVEFFDSPEQVVQEKKHLVDALPPEGLLVYNHDDARVKTIAEGFNGKKFSYGMESGAELVGAQGHIFSRKKGPGGMSFRAESHGRSTSLRLSGALGRGLIYTALAAMGAGLSEGLELAEMGRALERYEPPPGRMRIIEGIKGTVILDDSYNSSPVAAVEALRTLSEIESSGRKIAVLGDMLELGGFTMEEHKKLGELAAGASDVLFTVGVRARTIAEGAQGAGMSKKMIFQYEEAREAGKGVEHFLEEGDVVLVKGSQSVRMERIVEEIMAEPAKKGELLVRQDPEWLDRQ